jgi:hypothetical protein
MPIPDIVIIEDRNMRLPEFALVAKRRPLEHSTPLWSFSFPSGGPDRLTIAAGADKEFGIATGSDKPPHFNQINCGWFR